MEATPGEEFVKTVEITAEGLEYYINLVDKASTGSERIDPNSEKSPTLGKMLSNSMVCYREIICERKSQSMWQTSLLSYSKKLPQPPQPPVTTMLISQQPSTLRQGSPPARRLLLTRRSDDG